MREPKLRTSHFILILTLVTFAACQINSGEQMTSAFKCKTDCVDKGGVFCRGFGDETNGYCCYQPNQLPCDQRQMMCTNSANQVSKYYSCPFNTRNCGTQTLDVTDSIQEFEVYSADFKNFTFCGYQFRKVNVNSKTINIKVIYAGDRLEFQAVQGEVINKGYNLQKLQSNKLYTSKANERIFLLAKSIHPMPDSFKVQYYLNTPLEDDIESQTVPTNTNTNQGQSTNTTGQISTNGTSSNNPSSSNKTLTTQTDNNDFIITTDTSSSGGGGGTAIVVVIAVLIILIPVGFGISYIIKRIRGNKNNNNDQEGSMPLPDHSQSNHTHQSPEHPSHFANQHANNLYPFNNPIDDSQNMQNVMNAIHAMERGHQGDDEPIHFIEILGRHGAPITIPIDQLPQFLQDMALNDPEIFHQLMTDMDEEKLEEFIKEQDAHNNNNNHNFYPSNMPVNSEMGFNLPQMDFVDPMYLNEQQDAFKQFNKKTASKKNKRENNFMMMNNGNDGNQQQPQHHINLDDNENNLDMLVNGGGGGMIMDSHGNEIIMDGDDPQIIYEQPRKKKTKKKKKKKATAADNGSLVMDGGPIEIIEDMHTPELPVVFDPQE